MDRIQKKWDRLKRSVRRCPRCKGHVYALNRRPNSLFERYYLNCERCFYYSRSAATIKGAINIWNQRKKKY